MIHSSRKHVAILVPCEFFDLEKNTSPNLKYEEEKGHPDTMTMERHSLLSASQKHLVEPQVNFQGQFRC